MILFAFFNTAICYLTNFKEYCFIVCKWYFSKLLQFLSFCFDSIVNFIIKPGWFTMFSFGNNLLQCIVQYRFVWFLKTFQIAHQGHNTKWAFSVHSNKACFSFSKRLKGKSLYVVPVSPHFLQEIGSSTKVAQWSVKP